MRFLVNLLYRKLATIVAFVLSFSILSNACFTTSILNTLSFDKLFGLSIIFALFFFEIFKIFLFSELTNVCFIKFEFLQA